MKDKEANLVQLNLYLEKVLKICRLIKFIRRILFRMFFYKLALEQN